jgi:diguanylate cyclase (GGDEF)-like protein
MGTMMDKILLVGLDSLATSAVTSAAPILKAQIFEAADAAEMAHLTRKNEFALVILDQGITATIQELDKQLQALSLSPATTLLIIVPSDQSPVSFHTGVPGGVIDSLPRPLTPALLTGKIRPLLHIHRLQQELLSCQKLLQDQQNKNQQWQQSLAQQSHYLNMLSVRDGLTGLFNRRQLGITLEENLQKARQENTDLALLLVDIDYFNETNRVAGQHFGDSILNQFAARLTQNSRDEDLCFRFGGADFIVLLPGMNKTAAKEQAEKIRLACSEHPFTSGNHSRTVTVSISIVTLLDNCPKDVDEFLTMADKAMYQAKSQGRNRIVVYDLDHTGQSSKIDSISLLQETLRRILEKTKDSSIASIQILTQNVTGTPQDDHVHLAAQYIHLICGRLGLPNSILETFTNALILYNCFRSLLYRELLTKKETFSREERKVLQDLPYKLAELTQHFDYFANERTMLLCQGEHYDGSGYPEGLSGDEIPLASRIFSLADSLAAMNADRPHRKRLTPLAIIDELRKGAGTQWDPSLVLLALDIVHEQQLIPLDEKLLTQTKLQITQQITGSASQPKSSLPQKSSHS